MLDPLLAALDEPRYVTVASASDPAIVYRVLLRGGRGVACDCRGFHFRSSCHHVTDVTAAATAAREGLLLAAALLDGHLPVPALLVAS